MSRGAVAVAERPPGLSDARLALSEKIATTKQLEYELGRLESSALWFDGSASMAVTRAGELLEAARAELVQAKDRSVRALMGESVEGGPSVREARGNVEDSEEELAAAQQMRENMQARVEPLRAELEQGKLYLRFAAEAVIQDEIKPLSSQVFADYLALKNKLADATARMEFLMHHGALDKPNSVISVACAEAAEWKKAFEALQQDATAPLPAI